MRILMTVPHPGVDGPIPKLIPLMVQGLTGLGVEVIQTPYSRRLGTQAREESLLTKVFERSYDLKTLAFKARESHPDIILANTTQDWNSLLRDIPMALVARALRLPCVMLYHGSRSHLLETNLVLRCLTGFLFSMTDGLLLLSREELKPFKFYWPGYRYGIVRLPAFLDTKPASALPTTMPVAWQDKPVPLVLFAGRLILPKGVQEIVEAMPVVLQRVDCRLAILGEGELVDSLRRRISELGLERSVYLAGYIKDNKELWAWYNAAACLVLPTYWPEGFPVVVLEAMLTGLPIICTKVRGLGDYLKEGINALFVPPRDPQALAVRLMELLEDRTMQTRMSQANRELIQQFQPVEVMREYLEFFMQVLIRENSAA